MASYLRNDVREVLVLSSNLRRLRGNDTVATRPRLPRETRRLSCDHEDAIDATPASSSSFFTPSQYREVLLTLELLLVELEHACEDIKVQLVLQVGVSRGRSVSEGRRVRV